MIPVEKDRLECLRLAVVLMTPKSNTCPADSAAKLVVNAAEKFYEFVIKDAKRHE